MSAAPDGTRSHPSLEAGASWRVAALVAFAAFAVHAHTLGMDLVWDDFHHVKQNQMVRSLANVPLMFTTDAWAGGTQDTTVTPYYRPIYKLSLAVDHALWGERAFGYHLTNTLLHVLVAVLVSVVASSLAATPAGALVAGLAFAVHPVHSEAVAWISARNELLCALFMLLSLQGYLSWRARGRRRDLAVSLAAFFASLLAKELSITLPALVLVHEAAFGRRPGVRKLATPAAFAGVAAVYLLLRAAVLDVTDWGGAPPWHRLLTSFGIVARYLRLLVLPNELSVFHQVPVETVFFSRGVLVPLLVVGAAALAAVAAWRWDRRVAFALSWILITLAPVSGIPAELAPARMAERYLYVPSIGFALLAGTLAALALRWAAARRAAAAERGVSLGGGARAVPPAVVAAIGMAAAALAAQTFQRDRVWADQATFTRTWVREVPDDPIARVALGVVDAERGELADAEREYRAALALAPGFVDAHANLGVLYDKAGRADLAEREYRIALDLDPRNAEVLYDLGVHFLELQRLDEAERVFREVVAANPAAADAHYNLGLLGLLADAPERAVEHLEQAVRIDAANASYRAALERARNRIAARRAP